MKNTKILLLVIVSIFGQISAQNLITNSGFEDVAISFTVLENGKNVLMRSTVPPTGGTILTTAPSASSISVTNGLWLKSSNSTPWLKGEISAADFESGTSSLNLFMAPPVNTPIGTYNKWYTLKAFQKIAPNTLSNSRRYKVTFWAKLDGTANNGLTSLYPFLTVDGVQWAKATINLTGGTTWTKYTGVIDLPVFNLTYAANNYDFSGTAYFGFSFGTTADGSGYAKYAGVLIDNISLQDENAPFQVKSKLTNNGFDDSASSYTVIESGENVLMRSNVPPTGGSILTSAPTATSISVTDGLWLKSSNTTAWLKGVVTTADFKTRTSCLNLVMVPPANTAIGTYNKWYTLKAFQKLAPNTLSNSYKYLVTFWAKLDGTANNGLTTLYPFLTLDGVQWAKATINLTGGTTWTKYSAEIDLPAFVSTYAANNYDFSGIAYFGFSFGTTADSNGYAKYAGVLIDSVDININSNVFNDFKNNPTTAALPDYSYAGYQMGTSAIPTVTDSIFDVTQYGAIPNDNIEDFNGIQAAINAAQNAGGGIVFFPPGQFLMNEITNRSAGILISKPNIILRGSGSGASGTELFMRNYMLPADSTKMWTVPSMFTFNYYQASSVKTQIAMNAMRGEKTITVVDGTKLSVGSFINLRMQDSIANNEFLAGLTTYPEWTITNTEGLSINERHKIVSIQGNEVTLAEPLHTNITASYGWDVVYMPLTVGLGVEDIWFRGNFTTIIQHHLDFINDSGWGFLRMERADNGWVRRIRLTNVSTGISLVNSYACSVLHVRLDGNPGHVSVGGENSYGVLLGFIDDATNAPGMWHGPATSSSNAGEVIWRYRGQARSGPDFHASWPYCTLVDASTSKYIGNGGDADLLPNHMKDLTYWNHKEIGATSNIAFWQEHIDPPYGTYPPIVNPNIIGWQGLSTFDVSTLGLYEGYGEAVSPESLYEAQLALRLGSLPTWINDAKEIWNNYILTNEWQVSGPSYIKTQNQTIKVESQLEQSDIKLYKDTKLNGFIVSGHCQNFGYKIFTITGCQVACGTILQNSQLIPMINFKSGLYLAVFEFNGYKIVKKVIL